MMMMMMYMLCAAGAVEVTLEWAASSQRHSTWTAWLQRSGTTASTQPGNDPCI